MLSGTQLTVRALLEEDGDVWQGEEGEVALEGRLGRSDVLRVRLPVPSFVAVKGDTLHRLWAASMIRCVGGCSNGDPRLMNDCPLAPHRDVEQMIRQGGSDAEYLKAKVVELSTWYGWGLPGSDCNRRVLCDLGTRQAFGVVAVHGVHRSGGAR
jgi:hypothetical protein